MSHPVPRATMASWETGARLLAGVPNPPSMVVGVEPGHMFQLSAIYMRAPGSTLSSSNDGTFVF